MSLRLAFVAQASQPDVNLSALCAQFGISRPTGYKWVARAQQAGSAGLAERSRRPTTSPTRTAAALEQRVLALRAQHPAWGGRKLRARLQVLAPDQPVPAASTITAILQRHGLLAPADRAPHRRPPPQRFTYAAPNELWQMDFQGHLPLTAHPGGGQRCHPLTVLDDHSRFAVGVLACANEQHATVQAALTTLFRTYGLPRRILCDHGAPWGSAGGPTPWTRLSVWLVRLGVTVRHGRPRHPQTQGKDERFHRTLRAEALAQPLHDLTHAQAVFDTWRQVYNTERPHEALGLTVPARHYTPSPRPFPETLPPVEYAASATVRKVQQEGWISWQGQAYHVGGAFVGQPIALAPTDVDGMLAVYFADHWIASLDTRSHGVYPVSKQRSVVNYVPEHL
ncbi:MAG: ISxac4 transposase [Ktedonobacterales bacterium]|jgi:transposase InsO family protein|nr:MAG: ISxac4 transposase [Ktedonobacterales bacterium]WIG59909.1 MAG: ISxac4 transposase [Ktedonobacterales bacterium]